MTKKSPLDASYMKLFRFPGLCGQCEAVPPGTVYVQFWLPRTMQRLQRKCSKRVLTTASTKRRSHICKTKRDKIKAEQSRRHS